MSSRGPKTLSDDDRILWNKVARSATPLKGTAQLGPMSRAMKAEEIDAFEKKYGYKPTPIRVAVDGLAVFVNKDNPVKCLTMQQVDGIFSKGRACGGTVPRAPTAIS